MKKYFVLLFLLIAGLAQARSVVGIHGFLATQKSLNPVRDTLCPCGFDVYLWPYESRDVSICCNAYRLVDFLKSIACQCPGEPIDFVTHSIGAVVLRRALNLPECPEEARMGRAVLMAPPNQGSCMARQFHDVLPVRLFMGDQSGQELMTWGPCEIASLGAFPESMKVLVIAGCKGIHPIFNGQANDGFLLVDETRLETPYSFLLFQLSHGDLIKNRVSLQAMKDFLLKPCCS